MGGNIQKNKQNSQENKKGENQQLIEVNEKDLKEVANLGSARWFYNTQYISWDLYKKLSQEEKKKKIFWIIFPLEISNEIERAYINKFPYGKSDKMIFFNYLQKEHVLLINKNDSLSHIGIVKREIPDNKLIIKNENHFNPKNNYLSLLDNSINPYEYHLLNNLAMICYENIFSFFSCEMNEDKLINSFLSTTILCTQKLYYFLNNEYQEYLKLNFLKFKTIPFSLITLKSILLFDFKNEQIYLDYYLNKLEEKDFEKTIMNMSLEASSFGKQILEFPANCCKKNVQYTTFYLCLLYILMTQKDKKKNSNDNSVEEKKGKNKEIKKEKKNSEVNNNNKEVYTYIYLSNEYIKNSMRIITIIIIIFFC